MEDGWAVHGDCGAWTNIRNGAPGFHPSDYEYEIPGSDSRITVILQRLATKPRVLLSNLAFLRRSLR